MINSKEFPESIIERFYILAIDPRGAGRSDFSSEMIKCHFNENCNEDKKSISQYVSTTKFVHDIDYIRKELNEDKINFLGYSCGTKIGQLYSFCIPIMCEV